MVLSKRKSTRILAVVVVAVMLAAVWVSVPTTDTGKAYAAAPSGDFNPKAAALKQGTYDSDMYYVYYNGDINTKMTDKGNKAIGDEGTYGKADVMVTLDQRIVFIGHLDESTVPPANDWVTWKTAEETAENVVIGTSYNEGADAIWINLHGETVIPGFNDSHLHYESGGARRFAADIFWKSLAEIRIIIRNEVAKTVPGTRISASGWNQTLDTWNGGKTDFPTKEDLDSVSPENVVVLGRTDGHANWANSMALRMSPYGGAVVKDGAVVPGPKDEKEWPINIRTNALYPDPPGGVIIRDAGGMATGVFVDGAMGTVTEYHNNIPSASTDTNEDRNALSANDYLLSYGVTSFLEAGASESSILRYKRLYAEGKMKPRGYILVRNGTSTGVDTEDDVKFRDNNDPDDFKPENTDYRLTVRATKTSLDGALGSRGARLFEPYSDAGADGTSKDFVGAAERFTDDQVYNILKRNLDAGWNQGFHAIGDVANNQAIEAIEKYLEVDKSLTKGSDGYFNRTEVIALNLRPRIEHFQITTRGAIERAASVNLTPSMQFVHATSDMSMAGDRVGEARLQYSYAWRKIIDNNMVIANGTDWAVDLLNPYHGLSAGVTRMDRDGNTPKSPRGVGVPWNPITTPISKASDERVTRAEALHYYTYGGAYGEFAENDKGTLEVGKLADFVVLDRDYFDPTETKDSDIKDINALMTVVGGEICYTMERPIIITDEVGDARVGAPYAFTVTGNTDHSPTYSWSISDRDAALKWLQLDYHSGALSGIPTKPGTYEFEVTATNYLGSAKTTLRMVVNDRELPPEPPAPVKVNVSALNLTIASQAWTGKQVKPVVQPKIAGKTLVLNTDYKVAYGVNKNIGGGTLTITGTGGYTGSKTFSFKILPKKTTVSKTAVGKKKATVTWKKVSTAQKVTKYQVRFRAKGTSKWSIRTVPSYKASLAIKSLKTGKQYQFSVRAIKTLVKIDENMLMQNINYCGPWSSVKTSAKVK